MSQQYITIIVLLTGVFGGLGVVILLILFCKHCLHPTTKETGCENDRDVEREFSVSAALLEQRQSIIERQSVIEHKEATTSGVSAEEPKRRQSHLQRQSEIRSEPIEQSSSDSAIATELADVDRLDTPPSNHMTGYETRVSGLTNIDELDIYDRLYPDTHHQQDNPRWLLERDGLNHGKAYRVTDLSTGSSHRGSRRTLQSSMESSTCTDNRSEITVIERPPSDWMNSDYCNMRRSVSHDEPPHPPAPSPSRYLTATASPASEKRRQLSHREVGRPREYDVERRIKSQDDGYIYRLRKQDRLVAEDSMYRDREFYKEDKQQSIQYNEDHHSNTSVHDPISGRGSPYYSERCSPHDQWVTPTPVSVGSGAGSTHELWQLRSNLETEGSLQRSTLAITYGSEESLEKQSCTPVQFTDEAPTANTVCSVIYTSFDCESSSAPSELVVNSSRHVEDILDQGEETELDNFLQPPEQMYLNRRQNFQRIYTNRRKSKNLFDLNSSTERSFDSFDTYTTDGAHSSESSRIGITTTSFDSSTTADSSAESASRRQMLRDAKDDSGYKSTSVDYHVKPHASSTTRIIITPTFDKSGCTPDEMDAVPEEMVPAHYSRSASSRRRDFQTKTNPDHPQLNIQASFSSFELETTDSNIASCESIQESVDKGGNKYSTFLRVFQPGKHRRHKPRRDYSIDAKTDMLFKEFTRHDPKYDELSTSRSKSTGSIGLDINRDSRSFEDFSSSTHWRNNHVQYHRRGDPTLKKRLQPQASIC